MPLIKVDFYGTYRLVAGKKTLEIEFTPGIRLREMLGLVAVKVPELRSDLFDHAGNVFDYIPIYLNGRNPRLLEDGFDRTLRPDDVLSIFSPISSGRINVEEVNRLNLL
jgi:molybdopterin converting factor small subunit